jgi:hypothetical protein
LQLLQRLLFNSSQPVLLKSVNAKPKPNITRFISAILVSTPPAYRPQAGRVDPDFLFCVGSPAIAGCLDPSMTDNVRIGMRLQFKSGKPAELLHPAPLWL